MKRKDANERIKVRGFYVDDFVRGFFGEHNEGGEVLKCMGLPEDHLPFSVAFFLKHRKVSWNDCNGNKASISFVLNNDQMECFGSYMDKRKSIRLFREWNLHEDGDMVAKLESEAIGDLCMRCIYENLD